MKSFAIKLIWLASFIVFATAVFAQTTVTQQLLIILMVFGPILIMYLVYRVLSNKHHKAFDQWYEDQPRDLD